MELTQKVWQRTKNRKTFDKSRATYNVSRGKIGITRVLPSRVSNRVLQYIPSGSFWSKFSLNPAISMACLVSWIPLTLSSAQSRILLPLYFKILWIPGFPEKRRRDRPGGGRGGEAPSRKLVVQSSCQYDVTSRAHVSDLQNGKQSSSKRRMKISNLSQKNCSDFLDLAIWRSLLSQKTRLWYFFRMKLPVV